MLTAKVLKLLLVICSTNVVTGEVCYVCGNAKETITNRDNQIPIPNKYGSSYAEVDCKTLEFAGMNGSIPEDACADLHDSLEFKAFCGCRSNSETYDIPAGFPLTKTTPTSTPSETHHTSTPSEGEKTDEPTLSIPKPAPIYTNRPNSMMDMETQKPSTYISPTTSPIDFQPSNEPIAVPSKVEIMDDGDLDEIQSVEPSTQPSTNPSEVPSSLPSSVPSDVPSDIPSAQPSADQDVSGVIVESSATIASLLTIVQVVPMAAMTGYMFLFLY